MAKPNRLFLLLTIYTVLLGINGLSFAGGASETAAAVRSTPSTSTTCTGGPDQPDHCTDPSYDQLSDGSKEESGDATTKKKRGQNASNVGKRRTSTSNKVTSKDNSATCPPDSEECKTKPRSARPRFKNGDIIELYNSDSSDIQIVFPSIVKGHDPAEGSYRVTKTTDGKEVSGLPEKYLHMYVPYNVDDEALCNIGDFKKNRPIIVRCTVVSYEAAASRGAMVLQGNYEVQVHATKANEEYTTTLPVWKLQRRYLAKAATAAA